MISGHARLVSRNAVEVGDQRYETKNILIATGSRPAVPPIPGIRSERVLDSNTVFALDHSPGKDRDHRRRLHRPGVRLLLQRNRLAGDRVRDAAADRRGQRSGNLQRACLQILKRNGVEFQLSCKVLKIDGSTIHYGDDGQRDLRLHSERHGPRAGASTIWDWKKSASISDRKESRLPIRARRTSPASGPAAMSPGRRMLAHAATREGHRRRQQHVRQEGSHPLSTRFRRSSTRIRKSPRSARRKRN